jgi:hypothetical protein
MGPYSNQFLSTVSPFSIISETGVDTEFTSRGEVKTTCPCCGSDMYVLKNDFLCTNKSCSLKAGNIVDYVAASEGHYSYKKAIESINLIVNAEKQIGDLRQVEEDLKLGRQVFSFFRNTAQLYAKNRTQQRVLSEAWLRKLGHNVEDVANTAVLWTSKEIAEFNKILLKMQITPITPPSAGYLLAIPYFSSYSMIGAVLIVKPNTNNPQLIRFSGEKFLWSGLMDAVRPVYDYRVTQNFALNMRILGHSKFNTPGFPVLGLLYNGKGSSSGFVPPHPVYLHYPDLEPNMAAVSALADAAKEMVIQPYLKPIAQEHQKTWSSYIVDFLADRISPGTLSEQMLHFIDSCRLTLTQRHSLVRKIQYTGKFVTGEQLKKHFDTHIILVNDKHQIRSSPEGYFAQEIKNGLRTDIANFTLEVKRNVIFPSKKEILTECIATFGSTSAKVSIPTNSLDNNGKVEDAVRMAWISTAGESETALPIIKDKNLFRKYISPHLKEEASRVPSLEGISMLGWSHDKSKFQGPGWIFTKDGYKATNSTLHSEIPFLECFSVRNMLSSILVKELPIEVRDCIAILVANMVRGSLSLKNHTVAYDSTPESRSLLSAVFSALGQETPFQLPQSKIADIEGCRDFPFYAGESRFSTSRLFMPMFYLDKDGREEGIYLDDKEVAAIRNTVSYIVHQVLDWIFSEEHKSFEPIHSLYTGNSLKLEGANIIKQACGFNWEVSEGRWQEMDKFLASIDKDNLGKVFALDISTQNVVINRNAAKISDAAITELSGLVTVDEVNDRCLKVSMVGMADVLQTYYQVGTINYGRWTD